MRQRTSNQKRSKLWLYCLVLFTLFSLPSFAQLSDDSEEPETPVVQEATDVAEAAAEESAGDWKNGKTLFNANCAACHALNRRMTGPALAGVEAKYSKEWLYKWIKNSTALIATGDRQAVAIWEEYNKSVMTAFPQLSNSQIDDILAYTSYVPPKKVADGPETPVNGDGGGMNTNIILGALALILLLLIAVLFIVFRTLKKFAQAQGIPEPVREERTPLWKAFVNNQFLVLTTAIFALLASAFFGYGFLMQVGVDQGYQPVQPIHFSHRIHAGLNGVDCKYCHSAARVSKHSNIPSLNVCMNCHKNIAAVAEEGEYVSMDPEYPEWTATAYNKEIQKIYDAVGWDTNTQQYTGETKPVRWVRIHNLPDFAYFNHSQHVTAGQIQCQTCHGPVEEMEYMYQYSPLTMGWCINCHRETNVNLAGNGYYEKIHDQLSKKYGVEQLTIAELGGLECGKCHY